MLLDACPLCAAHRSKPYIETKGYQYHRCAACGFAFLNPMPTQPELNEEYQGHKGITQEHYPHAASRKRKGFFRALRLLPYLRGSTVLDIGCGGGFFVNAARLLGARACGFDVDANTIAYARREFPKCSFHCSSFDEFRPEAAVDFVYCSEVIEHVPDPHRLLRLLVDSCKPGGHVFITTPDLSSPNVPANVADWPGFAPPAHVGLFTENNLLRLFRSYGFEPVRKLPDRKTGLKVLFRRTR